MKPAIVTLVAALTCASFADTIRLRNGTEYEGEVLAEKDDHYVVRIQVTKSIRDERKIPKTEVLEIIAEKKDAADFEAIKDLVPTPDLLSLEDYEKRTSAVEKFLATHSKSRLAKQASEILKTLDKEREAVAAGGIKFESKIIQSGDRQSRAYPLDAQIAAAEVKRLSEARDFTGALRAWTKLEKDFGSSSAYKDLVPFAHKLFTSQKAALDKSIASFEERLNKR
ncbi:MAG: PTPDL family protein, partial [Verrucomicrobiota bacterium]